LAHGLHPLRRDARLDRAEERLKATKAIGLFTQISLKNQVDDLMDQFRAYQGRRDHYAGLRRSYDLLMMKVYPAAGLRPEARVEIVSSREAIWALLSDQKKFAT
jgi:hypothetical protein